MSYATFYEKHPDLKPNLKDKESGFVCKKYTLYSEDNEPIEEWELKDNELIDVTERNKLQREIEKLKKQIR